MITKAVIPIAGLGSRLLPATKAIPKEMFPVVDKPMIQYVVEEAANAGIKEVVLVTHPSKNSVENHFDTMYELESQLESRHKSDLLKEVQLIQELGVKIISVRQSKAQGLGHAISCARPVIGDNDFCILLPDVLINPHLCNSKIDNIAAMISRFEFEKSSQIMLEPVPREKVHQYGIASVKEQEPIKSGNFSIIERLIEKPSPEDTPSNLAVVGRYVMSKSIWGFLEKLEPGVGGEIQLTDAIDALLATEKVEGYHIVGKSHDCGNHLNWLQTNIEFGLCSNKIGLSLKNWLKNLTF
ncbi:MAG: UTP--glucose-1-phosphate uridylyltransferase GalU [Pseudomonadota bacterium]